jgi:hypothetical protein
MDKRELHGDPSVVDTGTIYFLPDMLKRIGHSQLCCRSTDKAVQSSSRFTDTSSPWMTQPKWGMIVASADNFKSQGRKVRHKSIHLHMMFTSFNLLLGGYCRGMRR